LEGADDGGVVQLREHWFHVSVGDVALVPGLVGFQAVVGVNEHTIDPSDIEAGELLGPDEWTVTS
jgi:hypothetical protein